MKLKFKLSFALDEQSQRTTNTMFDVEKDSMFVCGSSKLLGEWNIKNAVEMRLKNMPSHQAYIDKISNLSVSSLSVSSSSSSEFMASETL
jgi:hypothetical protein